MRRNMPVTIPASLATLPDKAYFKISHINCRSLVCHFNDVSHHTQLLSSHVICISETWLQERHSTDAFNLPEYTVYRRYRLESYNDHSCPPVESQTCQKCNKGWCWESVIVLCFWCTLLYVHSAVCDCGIS